jgi:hypothetical protein
MENNCYKCQFRAEVPGSAHSQCKHPVAVSSGIEVLRGIVAGREPYLTNNDEERVLEFSKCGISGGWCLWPINFDPTWVTCKLEIPNQ